MTRWDGDRNQKPEPWAYDKSLVEPEWEWYWGKSHKSIVTFDIPVINDAEIFYDHSAKVFRGLSGSGSSVSVVTELGLGWKTNFDSSATARGVALGTDLLNGAASATALAYIKMHSESRDNTNEHIIYHENATTFAMLFRYDPAANTMEGFVHNGTTQVGGNFSSASDIDDGKFHAVALRYDGANIEFFLDGVKDATSFAQTGVLTGGAGATAVWSGGIAADGGQYIWLQAAAYREALSDGEIQQWANDPFGPFRMMDETAGLLAIEAAAAGVLNLVMAPYRPA